MGRRHSCEGIDLEDLRGRRRVLEGAELTNHGQDHGVVILVLVRGRRLEGDMHDVRDLEDAVDGGGVVGACIPCQFLYLRAIASGRIE